MDVTIDNFDTLYPRIKELCETCDFISFDEEMTGIHNTDPAHRTCMDDELSDRYAKMKLVASTYSIISFGVCFFHLKIDEFGVERYEATPFNFYVFPTSNRDVVMAASSITFLKEHNMDFNKWINKGISYCNEENETREYARYIEPLSVSPDSVQLLELTRSSDIEFFNSNIKRFDEFMASESTTHTFDKTNGFLRKSLYLYLDKYHAQTVVTSTNASGQLVATRLTEESIKMELEKKHNEAHAKFRKSVGFRAIISTIINSKKPFIGHNCHFDFLFLISSFIVNLPDSFDEFRALFHDKFPHVFDTKYVAESGILGESKFEDTALGPLYKNFLDMASASDKKEQESRNNTTTSASTSTSAIVNPTSPSNMEVEGADSMSSSSSSSSAASAVASSKSFVYCTEEFDKYVTGESFHNAGYDAFATGSVFAMQIKHLRSIRECHDLTQAFNIIAEKTENLLFNMFSIYHFDYGINSSTGGVIKSWLDGNMFHLTVSGSQVSFPDIEKVYIDAGIDKSNLTVLRIDRTNSFFLSLKGEISVDQYKAIVMPNDWILLTFSDYITKRNESKNGKRVHSEAKMSTDSSNEMAVAVAVAVAATVDSSTSSSSSNSNPISDFFSAAKKQKL